LLDHQQVVAPAVDDLLGNLLLTAGRVNGYQCPFQVEQRQQPGDGGDLVGVGVAGGQAQAQVGLRGPDVDQVQAAEALAGAGRAAHRLAVDGQVLAGQAGVPGVHPAGEALLEGQRVQPGKDALEGVVAWDSVGQLEKALEPVLAFLAEQGDLLEVVGPGDDGADGD